MDPENPAAAGNLGLGSGERALQSPAAAELLRDRSTRYSRTRPADPPLAAGERRREDGGKIRQVCVNAGAGAAHRSFDGVVTTDRFVLRHRSLVLVGAVIVPAALCAILSHVPRLVESTTAALLLVLVVVGAASTGLRSAGLLAAGSSALSFDYFLTAPYLTLQILDRADIEIAVGLVLVGVAVTELALWGRRQQARASEQSGYLGGLLDATEAIGGSAPAATVVEQVEHRLVTVLEIDLARFHPERAADLPRLEPDGRLVDAGHVVDVDRDGLPTDTEISLPVRVGERVRGEFRLTAATRVARPSRERRRVAVLLADQAGLALAQQHPISHEGN
ncbi:hypothetical protein GCM10022236_28060 [Microlunatus ginsengisoli]|uniref:Sensor protein KdpD transmembrane domain-containing protein n=1 Tax=Microlunatus ginsengisoli TaxID=363863 RepID=A0ABP7A3B2_9ACTN